MLCSTLKIRIYIYDAKFAYLLSLFKKSYNSFGRATETSWQRIWVIKIFEACSRDNLASNQDPLVVLRACAYIALQHFSKYNFLLHIYICLGLLLYHAFVQKLAFQKLFESLPWWLYYHYFQISFNFYLKPDCMTVQIIPTTKHNMYLYVHYCVA